MNADRLFLYTKDMYRNYYYHVGLPGHLKVKNYKELYDEKPQSLVIYGVWKTLQTNKNRKNCMKNLEVYKGLQVPYDFLPSFTPTLKGEQYKNINEELLKNSVLIDY